MATNKYITNKFCPHCDENMTELEVIDKDFVDEWCPHCENEVRLSAKFEIQECPICGKKIAPCALCDNNICDCSTCPLGQELKNIP